MHMPSHEQQLFVTLLTHQSPALQMSQLRCIPSSRLVVTNTFNETLTAIANKLFNLIIIDIDLIDFGPILTAKDASPVNYDTPIIAISDNLDTGLRKNLISSGFDDCLVKPLTTDKLNEIIEFWHKNDAITPSFQAIKALLTKCNDNYRLVLSLYNKLFEELPLQINGIKDALDNGHYRLALDITHKLNGSAKVCCLQDIEEWADKLEKCLVEKQYAEVNGNYLLLQQHVSSFINQRQLNLDYLESLTYKQ